LSLNYLHDETNCNFHPKIFTMLSRSLKLQQVWWQPQLIAAAAALPSSHQNVLHRLFADDALDPSEKVVLKTKDEAAKGAEAWDKTKGSVKETANESGAKLKSAVDKVKDHAQREVDTSRDMVKDIPKKTKETTQGLKEVGVEAAKAVKREAERLAEKVGMKEKKPGDLDKTES